MVVIDYGWNCKPEEAAGVLPAEWGVNPGDLMRLHPERDCYHPFIAKCEGLTAGFANLFVFGESGWVGNISVPEEFRGRGIGGALTDRCIDAAVSVGCTGLQLFATDMGKPLYVKRGFVPASEYIVMEGGHFREAAVVPAVSADAGDRQFILEADREINGEDRSVFLSKYMKGAMVVRGESALRGYYLPALGAGYVGAFDQEAGMALCGARAASGRSYVIAPANNISWMRYLRSCGFKEEKRILRMYFKRDNIRREDCIFNRGTGYSG